MASEDMPLLSEEFSGIASSEVSGVPSSVADGRDEEVECAVFEPLVSFFATLLPGSGHSFPSDTRLLSVVALACQIVKLSLS